MLEMLDDDNRHEFSDKKHGKKKGGGAGARSLQQNWTPDVLKTLIPPNSQVVLASSFQKCWGQVQGRYVSRHWHGVVRARRTKTEAVKQVLNGMWNIFEKDKDPAAAAGRPTDADIIAAVDAITAEWAKAGIVAKAKPAPAPAVGAKKAPAIAVGKVAGPKLGVPHKAKAVVGPKVGGPPSKKAAGVAKAKLKPLVKPPAVKAKGKP